MTEQVQRASFDIHMEVSPDGRLSASAQGNLNPAFIYAQLAILMRKLEQQMESPAAQIANTRTPEFKIRRLP